MKSTQKLITPYERLTSFDIKKLINESEMFSKIELKLTSRMVLLAFCDFYNHEKEKQEIYPSIAKIEKRTGCKESAVHRAIKELKNKGLIIVSGESGKSNHYLFTKLFFNLILSDLKENKNPCQKDTPTPVKKTVDPCQKDTLINKRINKKNNNFFKKNNEAEKQRCEIVLNSYHRLNTKEKDIYTILNYLKTYNFKFKNFPNLEFLKESELFMCNIS